MKYLNKLFILCLIFMVPFSGCNTDELQELNIDPNASNELDWKFMFTRGTVQSAENRYVNGRVNLATCAALTQHVASLAIGSDFGHGDKYLYNLDAQNAFMERYYTGPMKTMAEVIRQTGPDGLNPNWTNLYHMANVVHIFNLSKMTDLYGNVPNTEANKGIDGIFFPKYDSQESIYMDMLTRLEAAAANIGNGSDEVGSADIIYNGDFAKWKRLANSMMLRLAMRISNVDAATAQSFAAKAISGGVMTSNADNAFITMDTGPSEWDNQNGISRALNPTDWGADHLLSKTFIDHLQATNDPRLTLFAVLGLWDGPHLLLPEEQVGLPNGYDSETIKEFLGTSETVNGETTFSRINPKLLDVNDPWLLMTYSEVELLVAEAAMKGWGGGDAAAHYNAGVKAAMQMWNIFDESLVVDDAAVDAYLAANAFDNSEKMIAEQLWLATFLNWYETYATYRRTGFPELSAVNYPGNVSNGQVFRRLQYYTQEVANNPEVQIGGTLPDDVMTRIWWDVK